MESLGVFSKKHEAKALIWFIQAKLESQMNSFSAPCAPDDATPQQQPLVTFHHGGPHTASDEVDDLSEFWFSKSARVFFAFL